MTAEAAAVERMTIACCSRNWPRHLCSTALASCWIWRRGTRPRGMHDSCFGGRIALLVPYEAAGPRTECCMMAGLRLCEFHPRRLATALAPRRSACRAGTWRSGSRARLAASGRPSRPGTTTCGRRAVLLQQVETTHVGLTGPQAGVWRAWPPARAGAYSMRVYPATGGRRRGNDRSVFSDLRR